MSKLVGCIQTKSSRSAAGSKSSTVSVPHFHEMTVVVPPGISVPPPVVGPGVAEVA